MNFSGTCNSISDMIKILTFSQVADLVAQKGWELFILFLAYSEEGNSEGGGNVEHFSLKIEQRKNTFCPVSKNGRYAWLFLKTTPPSPTSSLLSPPHGSNILDRSATGSTGWKVEWKLSYKFIYKFMFHGSVIFMTYAKC